LFTLIRALFQTKKAIQQSSAVIDRRYRWLNRFVWFTAAATLFLICSGGMVTSKGVGLAVPDWPTTFGYNMFLFPVSQWVGGILFEHTHRLIASTVGLLTIILAVWLWLAEDRPWVRNLGLIAVGGVILQGILGGLRVTMLKDQIGTFHACLAQAFLGLLVFIALVTSRFWRSFSSAAVDRDEFRRLRTLALLTTIAIYFQLGLGALMRHQHRDLAILDFPTANGAWIPDTSTTALAKINAWRDAQALSNVTAFQIWLQMVHRLNAVFILVGVTALWSGVRGIRAKQSNALLSQRQLAAIDPVANGGSVDRRYPNVTDAARILQRLSMGWLILLFFQLTLGAWTIWSNKAADIATVHVAVGAIMLSLGVVISAICWRFLQDRGVGKSAAPVIEAEGAIVV
jgi:cytochrome c oxidase assembly protein subunit 15